MGRRITTEDALRMMRKIGTGAGGGGSGGSAATSYNETTGDLTIIYAYNVVYDEATGDLSIE